MRDRRLFALALLAGACQGFGAPVPPKFETVKADRGRIAARVTASGTLAALVTVQVGTQVSGRIHQLFADFNDVVKKGQVVARIDPQLFQAAVEQARANLVAVEGQLARVEVQAAEARRVAAWQETLEKQRTAAHNDVEVAAALAAAADAQVKSTAGQVEQARAALRQAEINLANTTIRSPIDGMIISRAVDVGQTVAASLQSPTLFTIAEDLRKMQVETAVSEADIGRVQPGMPASFTVDAWPGRRFKGTVRQVRNAPISVQNVVTYTVVMDVENPDLALKPGMTATTNFTYAERDDALRVPNAALRFRPSPDLLGRLNPDAGRTGGHPETSRVAVAERSPDKRTVWLLRDGAMLAMNIQVGITDGSFTEVTGGDLKDGDELVTEVILKDNKPTPLGGGMAPGGAPGGRRGL